MLIGSGLLLVSVGNFSGVVSIRRRSRTAGRQQAAIQVICIGVMGSSHTAGCVQYFVFICGRSSSIQSGQFVMVYTLYLASGFTMMAY